MLLLKRAEIAVAKESGIGLAYEGSVRLIVEGAADGRWNMAVDEALLESVSSGASGPVVRLYGFEPATLSVGRFQRTAGSIDFERLAADGLIFVRRPSGGQAVLHAEELTYAVILGKDHLIPFGKRQVYRFAAPLLLAGLTALGVRSAASSTAQRGNPLNPDCFGSTGEYEIDAASGRKLVGSAQMLSRTAVLQHGSIPLTRMNRKITRYLLTEAGDPSHASSVSEEMGEPVDFVAARSAFAHAIGAALQATPNSLTEEERERAERLYREKYTGDAWNRSL